MLHGSLISRRNTLVVPGGKMGLALQVIVEPIIEKMIDKRRALLERDEEERRARQRPSGRSVAVA